MSSRIAQGENLYVHCYGGRGRGGLVVSCLLAESESLGADAALSRVQAAFETRGGPAGKWNPFEISSLFL